jgi:hypothetical protein
MRLPIAAGGRKPADALSVDKGELRFRKYRSV